MTRKTITGFRHLYNQLSREQQLQFQEKIWNGKASTMYLKMKNPMSLYVDEFQNTVAFLNGHLGRELDYTDLTCVVELKAEITK